MLEWGEGGAKALSMQQGCRHKERREGEFINGGLLDYRPFFPQEGKRKK